MSDRKVIEVYKQIENSLAFNNLESKSELSVHETQVFILEGHLIFPIDKLEEPQLGINLGSPAF